MRTSEIFTAATKNGQLSEKEYVHLASSLATLLQGIKTQRIRAILKPKPGDYPGYQLNQGEYAKEKVSTSHNHMNTLRLDDMSIPVRLYDICSSDLIAGLTDEMTPLSELGTVFLNNRHAITDPSGLSRHPYLHIDPTHLATLSMAKLELEEQARLRTMDFFEDEDRAVEIEVNFYSNDGKYVKPGSPVLVAFDFSIL